MSARRVDRMFRAFADETRLRILHLLSRGELCVCDIMAALRAPQSKVSRHLGHLRRAGLVTGRKEGLWRHYSLAKPSSPFQKRLIDCLGACMDEVGMLQRDARRLDGLGRRGRPCR
ncbi:MAG: winged helix-turn-helix transcriptional regulator [Elusimicrobia bacterium]|nr:winged helix-turn-helix transcriptional regulator [Elusimicrobiota bacterium]